MKMELTNTVIGEEGVKIDTEIFDLGDVPFLKGDTIRATYLFNEFEVERIVDKYAIMGYDDEIDKAFDDIANVDLIVNQIFVKLIAGNLFGKNTVIDGAKELEKAIKRRIRSQKS